MTMHRGSPLSGFVISSMAVCSDLEFQNVLNHKLQLQKIIMDSAHAHSLAPPYSSPSPSSIVRMATLPDSQAYSSEVYSWSPVYRNQQRGSNEPHTQDSSSSNNRQSVLFHSGLKQQVQVVRQEELQEEGIRKGAEPEVSRSCEEA